MNLSPQWAAILEEAGIEAFHWADTGNYRAPDIDFTTLLALTRAEKPGVILIRAKNILPSLFAEKLVSAIKNNSDAINSGAILVVDDEKQRIRILPLT